MAEHVEEFYPSGATRDDFCVEVRSSYGATADTYDVVLWTRRSGNAFGVPIRSLDKARRIARNWYHVLLPEYQAEKIARSARNADFSARLKVEHEARREREAAERAARLAKVTRETERVTVAVCPMCEHAADPEEFGEPSYECATDGPSGRGEDGRRCPTCSKFCAKATDYSCENCESPLDDEPDTIDGVEIDGVFIPETELPKEVRVA